MILKLPNFDDRIVKCFTVHDIFFLFMGGGIQILVGHLRPTSETPLNGALLAIH